MICVEKLNISFDRTILKDGSISVYENELTVVFGDSGCGKTSLLYCLGLFSQDKSFAYAFDGRNIDLRDDEEIGFYKKKKIGFVFQDKNLFENLTIYENIRFNLKLAECEEDDATIDSWLSSVDLKEAKNKYPRQLSGGEQQRAAILCAIAKQPQLLVVDEPTSSLDNTNADKVIRILHSYADSGHMVIVSSHDNRIREASDRIYEINDGKVSLIEAGNATQGESVYEERNAGSMKEGRSSAAIRYYNRRNIGKKGVSNIVMIILCSLVIAFGGLLSSFGESYVKSQNEYLNRISDREIFVVNMTAPLDRICDCDGNLSMTDEEVAKLSALHHVVECYPYYEFVSYGFDKLGKQYISGGIITITADNETTVKRYEGSDSDSYNLRPFYGEKDMSKSVKTEYAKVDDGIYLNASFARNLGLNGSEKNVSISAGFCVPVGIETAEMKVGGASHSITTDAYVYVYCRKQFTVNGILDDSIQNTYALNPDNSMYMGYECFTNILAEALSDFREGVAYPCEPLRASAYVVYVDDYSMIDNVKESIQRINPDFRVQSNYQDIITMQEMLHNTSVTMKLVFWVVLACIFVMMSIIQMNRIVARKYEIALLRADGLTNRELRMLTGIEAIESALLIIVASILFAWILSSIFYLSSGVIIFEINLRVLGAIVLLSLLATSIPTLLTVVCFQRYQPATVMRNK